ncbi:hypothetical protein BJ875DRAFT_479282 [Amylocarpus encephaloides]|uniref:ORP1 like protein n=1 Tax=Amylocarpus encephaloides TaxID=45428 RepID=A0A9P7YTM9_9HELO|nr:hypothetical protein BJ875DRAFT_479282 [Amylocarpus encephaloides]
MDVTSMLNAGSLDVEQKKMEEIKTQGRSRTPWDAGGYSLPITSKTPMSPPSQQPQRMEFDDNQVESPISPRHKLSDSRSSLSSFTSSLPSATHSRFSSISTVSGSHSLNSIAAEVLSSKSACLHLSSASSGNPPDQLSSEPRTINPTATSESLDALATIAENRLSPQQETDEKPADEPTASTSIPRPSSPSDAILIKRTAVPALRLDTGHHDIARFDFQQQQNLQYLSAPTDRNYQSLLHPRPHKRSASAPDFQSIMDDSTPNGAKHFAEPTPPTSNHPDNVSPTSPPQYPEQPDTPQTALDAVHEIDGPGDIELDPKVCMYIKNCDTESQLRKAISHIFGRNKMCTRLIPDQVWVHYCRKHYQRSRYRNPKEYAKLQCDLVQMQIRRIHEWSRRNHGKNMPGYVANWTLSVRKREQQRLDSLGAKRKRSAGTAGFENDDSDRDLVNDNRALHSVPVTAVPGWLLERTGKGYDTRTVLELFSRLHEEILSDALPCFPDIEILPNIIVNESEDVKEPKGYVRRAHAASVHKRSQSLGVAVKNDSYTAARRQSQPSMWGADASKRRRQNEFDEVVNTVGNGFKPMRLPHRPIFANIVEHQSSEDGYAVNSPGYHSPLAAPTPQRYGARSMAAHLENEHASGGHRPMHQRSQSHDVGSFIRGRSTYSASPSYPPAISFSHTPGAMRAASSYESPTSYMPQNMYARPTIPILGYGHSRHQSSPLAPPVDFHDGRTLYQAQAHMNTPEPAGGYSVESVRGGYASGSPMYSSAPSRNVNTDRR